MDFHLWLGFAAASLIMAIVPGPGVASIIGFAFSSGRRVALASVAGMALGNATAMTISLGGAGAILASSAVAFTILKWAGAFYLIVVGFLAIMRAGRSNPEIKNQGAISARTAFLTNVAVGTFHPKTILFFVAFASQFIRPDEAYILQAAILVATFTSIAAATDAAYALAASRASVIVKSSKARTWAQRIGGGAIMGAGVAMAAIRR
jgi:threonine/homoserine/homoserine lactone efflux protein